MSIDVPNVKLNNGLEMPVFGLGTWQGVPGREIEVRQAVKNAIDIGYRLFDCAHAYENERAIGEAFQEKIEEGVVTREDLFVISKLWCNSHRRDLVEPALITTLDDLQTSYLDLYLIHWPMAFQEGEDLHPTNSSTGEFIYSEVDYVSTWKAMEHVYRKNLTTAIGVSNFNSKQLDRILNICTVFPQVNQVECHPFLNQLKLRQYCDNNGIVVMAYSPLGGPRNNIFKDGDMDVLKDPRIKEIADRYKKTSAQILLKYNLQLENVVIPKSSNKSRLLENIQIFDFYIAPEDMSYINSFNCNGRVCRYDEAKDHIFYPFCSDVEF